MGVEQRDVDDALTIIYLLGRSEVDLLGITTAFGNDSIDIVYRSTQRLLRDLDYSNLPLSKGNTPNDRCSEASEFLVDIVNRNQGEITILATGALTNLYGAYLTDPDFFDKVKQLVLMGGVLEPLLINGHQVDELNFSCDPEATFQVLQSSAPSTVITGHLCLNFLFGESEFQRLTSGIDIPIYRYIYDKTKPWADFMDSVFSCKGFYNWDVVAGVYATQPDLFHDNQEWLISTTEDLTTGLLKVDSSGNGGYRVNIPKAIKDIHEFNKVVFDSWQNVSI